MKYLVDYPELVKQIHPLKNSSVAQLLEIDANSEQKIWWLCHKNVSHEYRFPIYYRCKINSECPLCANYTLFPDKMNSLLVLFPDLALEFDVERNLVSVKEILPFTKKKYWWKCIQNNSHRFREHVFLRTKAKKKCPCCLNIVVAEDGNNSLQELYPEIAECFDIERNGGISPNQIAPYLKKKYNWRCKNNHLYKLSVIKRVKGLFVCRVCIKEGYYTDLSLGALFPVLLKLWDYTNNEEIDPMKISYANPIIVNWICKKGHTSKASINKRTREEDPTECGICANKQIAADGSNSIEILYPFISAQFDLVLNARVIPSSTPANLVPGSHKIVHWICPNGEDHRWKSNIYDRTIMSLGCPYCSNQMVSVTNNVATTYPEVAKDWHYKKNGDLRPEDFVYGSNKSVWWLCYQCGYEWKTIIASRTQRNAKCKACLGMPLEVKKSGWWQTEYGKKEMLAITQEFIKKRIDVAKIDENYIDPHTRILPTKRDIGIRMIYNTLRNEKTREICGVNSVLEFIRIAIEELKGEYANYRNDLLERIDKKIDITQKRISSTRRKYS